MTVKRLAEIVDVVVVIGAANSSNSNRLVEVAKAGGVAAYRVSSANELRPDWFSTKQTVGITAGGSGPEVLVTEGVGDLPDNFEAEVEEGRERHPEGGYVPLPLEIR